MSDSWEGVRFAGADAIGALAATNVHVAESYARSRIEAARSQFRQGLLTDGADTLFTMLGNFEFDENGQDPAGLRLILAVAYAVLAQGYAHAGRRDDAEASFRESADRFRRIDDELLSPRDHSDFGVALLTVGDDFTGLRHLLRSRIRGGATPEAARDQACLYLTGGKVTVAEELLKEALLTMPTDAEALRSLAGIQLERGDARGPATLSTAIYALMVRGRQSEALELLDRLEALPHQPDNLVGVRAEILRLNDRPGQAFHLYSTALQRDPTSTWLLVGQVRSLMDLEQWHEAAECARNAVQVAPDHVELLTLAAENEARLRNFAEAERLGRHAVQVDDRNGWAHYLLALVLRERAVTAESSERDDLYQQALREIRFARTLDPSDTRVVRTYGEISLEAGHVASAREAFRQVCESDSADTSDFVQLLTTLDLTGRHAEALEIGGHALDRFAETPHDDLTVQVAELQLADDPVASSRLLEDVDAGYPGAALVGAGALTMLGDRDGALRLLDRAHPDDAGRALAMRAACLAGARRWAEAAAAAEKALDHDPTSVDALWIAATEDLAGARDDDAEQRLRRAALLDPTHPAVRLHLARAIRRHSPDEATALLEALLDEPGDHGDPLRVLATVHLEAGDIKGGLGLLEAAATHEAQDGPILADLADSLRVAGQAERSLSYADRAVELDPERSFPWAVRASAYIDLGRRDEARQDIDQALAIHGDYAYAHILMAQIVDDDAETEHHLALAREYAPKDRLVLESIAGRHLDAGRHAEASAAFAELLEAGVGPEHVADYVEQLRLAGATEEAVDLGQHAQLSHPDDDTIKRNLALAYLDVDRKEECLALLTELEDRNGDALSKSDLGWLLARDDERFDEALTLIQDALALAPDDVWTLNLAATLLSQVGDFRASLDTAARATDLDPSSADAWSRISWEARYVDPPERERALEAAERAVELGGESPGIWFQFGLAEARQAVGDPRAATDFRRVLALIEAEAGQSPDMLPLAAWCQYRLGQLDDAARMFLEASTLEDQVDSSDFDLALVTLCHGRERRAQRLYADAIGAAKTHIHRLRARGLIRTALADVRDAERQYGLGRQASPIVIGQLEVALAELPVQEALLLPPAT